MNNREAYELALRTQLQYMQAEIDRLQYELESANADRKIALNEQVEKVCKQQEQVKEKVRELRDASSDAWDDMKTGVQDSIDILAESVKSATNRFL